MAELFKIERGAQVEPPPIHARRVTCCAGYEHRKSLPIRALFNGTERLGYLFDQFYKRNVLVLGDLVGKTPNEIFQNYRIPFKRKRYFFERLRQFGFSLEHPSFFVPTAERPLPAERHQRQRQHQQPDYN